jgi:hypothetical protein
VPEGRRHETPRDGGKEDVASWDGKSGNLQTYTRQVRLWQAYSRTEASRQGIRLLAALKDDAFSKLQLVDPESFRRSDGVEALLGLLRERYEPLAHRKVGQVMGHFLYSFKRGTEESAMDFSFRFDKELAEAQGMGEVAHLFLRKPNLRPEQEAMILASSLGM